MQIRRPCNICSKNPLLRIELTVKICYTIVYYSICIECCFVSLNENLALRIEQVKLKKQIEKVEKLARAEKQPKKFELVQRIRTLERKIN